MQEGSRKAKDVLVRKYLAHLKLRASFEDDFPLSSYHFAGRTNCPRKACRGCCLRGMCAALCRNASLYVCDEANNHPGFGPASMTLYCTDDSKSGFHITLLPIVQLIWSRRVCFCHTGARVFALDAAMPFDFEHKATQTLKRQRALNIAIIGFGTFGQFLAKRLIAAGHNVSPH